MVGVPAVTVNAPASFATSLAVVTVTSVEPNVAAAVTETGTVMLVVVADVGAPAVTAALLNVTTDELLKCVKFPVIVTGTLLAPCDPVLGLKSVMTGIPAFTVNPFVSFTTSLPVVTVRSVAPSV